MMADLSFNDFGIYHGTINFITFKMIQDNQTRKSKRAHVTNPMYSEGIDELRKDAEIRYRKKCRNSPHHLPQDKKNSFSGQQGISDIDIEPQQAEEHDQHILCILPNERILKLQIIVSKGPPTPKMEPLREEKPARKHSTDLLSIFEQVIKQAGYDCSLNQNEKAQTVEKAELNESEQKGEAYKQNEEKEVKEEKNFENEVSKALAPENEDELNNPVACKKDSDEKLEGEEQVKANQDENSMNVKKSYEILERQEINLTQN